MADQVEPTVVSESTSTAERDRVDPRRSDLYEAAYREGQRTLDDQQDELNGIRDRSVQFAAFVGAATAFLVGAGLHPAHRDGGFYTIAVFGTVASATMILFLALMLWPAKRKSWNYRMSPRTLVTGWIEREVPPPSTAHFYEALTVTYETMRTNNEKLLEGLRNKYLFLIVSGCIQVTLWAVLVWAKG